MTETRYLDRPEGRIAYDDAGLGPLVVLVPGMGDLRSTYRFLAPALVSGGYRVVTTDLRGHGDSEATFSAYGDVETAGDLRALIEHLGQPAVLVGNSMGSAAAVLVAADHPDLVRGLVLVGPFVRDPSVNAVQKALLRLAIQPLWAAQVWRSYLPSLYAGQRPADFDAYRAEVVANLRRPGRARAFAATTRTTHAPAEARVGDVRARALVVMGERDPDFPDPATEAEWIARSLGDGASTRVVMVPEAGHYPQSQRIDVVAPAITEFLGGLPAVAPGGDELPGA